MSLGQLQNTYEVIPSTLFQPCILFYHSHASYLIDKAAIFPFVILVSLQIDPLLNQLPLSLTELCSFMVQSLRFICLSHLMYC